MLANRGALPSCPVEETPETVRDRLNRVDVAYYRADAAEVGSLELSKVTGVEAAFDVLGVDEPFALVMGDSKTDLRVMEWAEEHGLEIGAAPTRPSDPVVEFVERSNELLYAPGDSEAVLRTVYALVLLARLEGDAPAVVDRSPSAR